MTALRATPSDSIGCVSSELKGRLPLSRVRERGLGGEGRAQRERNTPDSIAPWAEPAPDAPYPLTVEDMLALPDDGYIYELVDGVLLRMDGSGGRATVIGGNMYAALRAFVLPRRLGVATPADGVYKFPGAETGLIPEAGYYRAERLDRVSDQSKPLPFAPDLAAEVASPDQTAADMAAKAQRYVRGGTRLVWVLWPDRQEVDVWRPLDVRPRYQDMRPSTTLRASADDVLDGEDVIPGFTLTLTAAFAGPLG